MPKKKSRQAFLPRLGRVARVLSGMGKVGFNSASLAFCLSPQAINLAMCPGATQCNAFLVVVPFGFTLVESIFGWQNKITGGINTVI
jgi:hypothetical protein